MGAGIYCLLLLFPGVRGQGMNQLKLWTDNSDDHSEIPMLRVAMSWFEQYTCSFIQQHPQEILKSNKPTKDNSCQIFKPNSAVVNKIGFYRNFKWSALQNVERSKKHQLQTFTSRSRNTYFKEN